MPTVRDFGAKGDGTADDSDALRHAVEQSGGVLTFPPGTYRITKPIPVPLDRAGPVALSGTGGTARIVMAGAGPALHLVGTHAGSALPASVKDNVWQRQRMPTVEGLEIVGEHPDADGVRSDGCMQLTLNTVLIRKVRHGVHLVNRNRNVVISGCHIYDNTGVGVFMDRVNLHQINITGSHISYCRTTGIRVEASQVRNIQIVGNDIEYNHDEKAETTSDVMFDCRNGEVREGTIVGNTIQAVHAPGGACVRLVGVGDGNPNAVGLLAVTGNLLGSRLTLLHLVACRGLTVSGNCLYSGRDYALHAVDSTNLVVSGNTIDRNPEYKGNSTDAILFERCRDVVFTGCVVQHSKEAQQQPPASVEVRDGENVAVTGCQVTDARVHGVLVSGKSSFVRVSGCTIRARPDDAAYRAAVAVEPTATRVMVTHNLVARGTQGDVVLPQGTGLADGNLVV
jgi:hypothetical protein